MDLGLKGKLALVTGGSRGIGKGIALNLASEGCNLVVCARKEDDLKKTAEEIRNSGVEVLPLVIDVSRKEGSHVCIMDQDQASRTYQWQ